MGPANTRRRAEAFDTLGDILATGRTRSRSFLIIWKRKIRRQEETTDVVGPIRPGIATGQNLQLEATQDSELPAFI